MTEEMTIREGFKQATEGKGFLQYILACICVAVCFPLGMLLGLVKKW